MVQAVQEGWDVANEYDNILRGVVDDPDLEKARKNAAEKRKKEATPVKAKRGKSREGGFSKFSGRQGFQPQQTYQSPVS